MDDLDRLYDRLLANIRESFPHLLDRAFQLGDVSEHLVPYRLNRRELGFDSVRQYEVALMRLVAGERGYLRAEAAVQDAMRRALASPEPDPGLLRDHTRASVAIARGSAASGPTSDAATSAAPEDVPPLRPAPSPVTSAQIAPATPRPGPTVMGGPCRYCGHALPQGRPVTFCPSCGQNVTVQHCPACSTELEVGWQYCITCGRAMDEGEVVAPA